MAALRPARRTLPGRGVSRRPRLRLLVRVGGGLLLALVLVSAYQAARAAQAVVAAQHDGRAMRAHVTNGDGAAARRSLAALTRHARTARDATDGMAWRAASTLPLVGDDVRAVRTVAEVLDSLSRTLGPSALRLSEAVADGTLRPVAGRYDLAAIEAIAPDLTVSEAAVRRDDERLAAIDVRGLLPFLAPLVEKAQREVHGAARAADAGARAARLLPAMLGEEGPRRYLLVVQNNAEVRATGGLPGSFSELQADDGRVTMGFQGSAADVNGGQGTVPATGAEKAIYGDSLVRDVRDANLTPDFPRAAELMAAHYERRRDAEVDGVVSVDPLALAHVLRGLGPVDLPGGGQVTADNVATRLLHEPYQRLKDPEAQNEFFAQAARAIFDALMSGRGDQRAILRGLAQAAGEHRVLVWSREDSEQEVVSGTPVAGELDPGDGRPHVGLYLNDATAGKLQYFLDTRASLGTDQCTPAGRQALQASMLLESRVPERFGRLSSWVLGTGEFAERGQMLVNLRVYAPAGGEIVQVTVDGQTTPVTDDEHEGRPVATVPLVLGPGDSVLVTASIQTAAGQAGDTVLDLTPGVDSQPNGIRVRSACG